MYHIDNIEDVGDLFLRIEIEDNLYWGFRVVDREGQSDKNFECNYLEVELKNLKFERNKWWLGGEYLLNSNGKISFKNFDEDLAVLIKNKESLDALVEDIVLQIEEKCSALFREFKIERNML